MALAVAPTPALRAAIYVRVSSVSQEQDGTSLQTQGAACRAYALAHGYSVDDGDVYREVFTGVELWERPLLTRLRDAVRRREVGVVVAYAIDRLARDPVHLGVVISEAEHAGVAVEFVTEPLDHSPEANSSASSAVTRRRSSTRRSRNARSAGSWPGWPPASRWWGRRRPTVTSGRTTRRSRWPPIRPRHPWFAGCSTVFSRASRP